MPSFCVLFEAYRTPWPAWLLTIQSFSAMLTQRWPTPSTDGNFSSCETLSCNISDHPVWGDHLVCRTRSCACTRFGRGRIEHHRQGPIPVLPSDLSSTGWEIIPCAWEPPCGLCPVFIDLFRISCRNTSLSFRGTIRPQALRTSGHPVVCGITHGY